jgi:hypothetical protein
MMKHEISRRDFIKQAGAVAGISALGGLEVLAGGCAATLGLKEEAPVIYPPLKGHKVQPPREGCLFGLRQIYSSSRIPGYNIPAKVEYVLGDYEKTLGKRIAIFAFMEAVTMLYFPAEAATIAVKKGVIPLLYADIQPMTLSTIVAGRYDDRIARFAREARAFGEQYGGFFFLPMWELNLGGRGWTWPWSAQPGCFQKAWIHMWEIFEREKANQYATWVAEYHVRYGLTGYYPGDRYVDWIGFSGYFRKPDEHRYGYQSFGDIMRTPYQYFRRFYPSKPIMVAEFGASNDADQAPWLRKALEKIKIMPGLKAALYWDNVTDLPGYYDDHTLSDESITVLKEALKAPYWIGADGGTEKGATSN